MAFLVNARLCPRILSLLFLFRNVSFLLGQIDYRESSSSVNAEFYYCFRLCPDGTNVFGYS